MGKSDFEDYSAEPESDNELEPTKELWHPEKARIRLAYCVLIGIFAVFIITIAVNWLAKIGYVDTNLSNELFELCRTGLLPIVTLILGYYFSKN